ncbi:MAG: PrsW family intramembrane metalloprotease [Bacteroidales bacterium]|nr:PrsW family intramembrane metalloprotease [Bacteroidales bacterium]
MSSHIQAAWNAFIVAATTEEFFKFFVIMIFIWRSKHFNEPFDGIVYAVYVSLGFALVENIMYVVQGGTSVALLRAITAVPAHAIFGISMGYYVGMAKYKPKNSRKLLSYAIIVPVILHGLYDFIIMVDIPVLLIIFVIYVPILYIYGLRKVKYLSKFSGEQLKKQEEEKIIESSNHEDNGLNINDLHDIETIETQTETENTEKQQDIKRGFDV